VLREIRLRPTLYSLRVGGGPPAIFPPRTERGSHTSEGTLAQNRENGIRAATKSTTD
jgi:hypothetical protein